MPFGVNFFGTVLGALFLDTGAGAFARAARTGAGAFARAAFFGAAFAGAAFAGAALPNAGNSNFGFGAAALAGAFAGVALAALGNSNANFFFGAGGGVAGFDGFLAKKAEENKDVDFLPKTILSRRNEQESPFFCLFDFVCVDWFFS